MRAGAPAGGRGGAPDVTADGASGGAPRDVGAVVNATRILRCLASSPAPLGVAAVARATGISTSTCFSILRTLARTHFASFDPGSKTYRLGLAMAEMAAGLSGAGHVELIRPELERLALNYETLVLLWRLAEDDHLVLVDRAHGRAALRVEIAVGYRQPMLAGAIGRCVAARLSLPAAELRRRFAAVRLQAPIPFAAFERQVGEARERGWALDDGSLFRGVAAVAALACDGDGRPRFGFSAVSIREQQGAGRLEALGGELAALAALVERSLSGGGTARAAAAAPGRDGDGAPARDRPGAARRRGGAG